MKRLIATSTLLGLMAVVTGTMAVSWPNVPVGSTNNAPPMTMLVMGKDHKLFYEAYNDASDIDGDGSLDIKFKPTIQYYGLFDANLCYNYTASGIFEPAAKSDSLGRCTGSVRWSGRWLNYMTTTRIDALRKVLYGGQREIDSATDTVLRRSYIPQDAHTWGKEYHSLATDGYQISQYTPYAEPTGTSSRHFFGSLTQTIGLNCSTISTCANQPPLLRVRTNVSNARIWEWASKEGPVLNDSLFNRAFPAGTGAEENFQVRVRVCTTSFNGGCKQYPNGNYKPIGILHEYGEEGKMLFGLISGSYDQPMSGGRLRKPVSSIANEINPSDGTFTFNASLVNTLNNFRIRDWNNGHPWGYYSGGWVTGRKMSDGEFSDWGNPIGEMLYEATRYFAGRGAPTSAYSGGSTRDTQMGIPVATWDNPYASNSQAKAAYCAKANFLVISDINPSYDSDQIPGSYFNSFAGDLNGFNSLILSNLITNTEGNVAGRRFIGQSLGNYDTAPSPKGVSSLGSIRGLAPEEPTKEGSYYSAASSLFAKTNDLQPSVNGKQSVDSYVVALSSPIPEIKVTTTGGQIITLIPFGKSVNGFGISSPKGYYQPTNQIVDFYISSLANSDSSNRNPNINGGRYYAEFLVNFEDVEQGADHDMDAIARYSVAATADNGVEVTVTPIYESGSIQQNMGYVVSGSNRDGVYLVARDEASSPAYFLNVPAGRSAGYCDTGAMPSDCAWLPSIGQAPSIFKFLPGSDSSARLLPNPLWYTAKYGGFIDANNNNLPDLPGEWDSDADGVPDTYFLVQNPLKLRDALKKAFDEIVQRNGSSGNIAANSTSLSTDAFAFQASFNTADWSGDLQAFRLTGNDTNKLAWRASTALPMANQRNIFFGRAGNTSTAIQSFEWGQLNSSEQQAIGSADILAYLRGERSQEARNNGPFRNRNPQSPLGDIAHSSPAYSKDLNAVFVGANDGMLHAFHAANGHELMAYIPSATLTKLRALSRLDYNGNHTFSVDGEIAISTRAQTRNENWLVGMLGRGGKGLYGLNVTHLSNLASRGAAWEYVDATDPDLGFMLGKPVIGQLTDGTWAVFAGNGFNSTNQQAALYVFRLTDGTLLRKIVTGTASVADNGMGTPALMRNNNGRVTGAYAADLRGNVWKFNIDGPSSAWGVAFGGLPFFTARDANSAAQPITSGVTVVRNDDSNDVHRGRWYVLFGTGSDFQTGDASNTQRQTFYGLIDKGQRITGRQELRRRDFSATGTDPSTQQVIRTLGAASVNDMDNVSGYFLDLPQARERVTQSASYYKLAEPVALFSSMFPVDDVCAPGGSGYVNAINAFTGARLKNPFFDLDDDGNFQEHAIGGVFASSFQVESGFGKPGSPLLIGNRLVLGGTGGSTLLTRGVSTGLTPLLGRIAWREIVRN